MKQTQRHNGIIELVKQQGYVSTEELVEHFSVSPQTIRRDLNELAEQNLILRHHGGAALPSSSVNTPWHDRKATQTEEKERIAREKSDAELQAQQEQLRANLLRTISHDLRTPLTSISGNAGVLMENSSVLDEAKKQRLYADIYDDSMWLINLVENLLSVTRLEEGRLNLRISTSSPSCWRRWRARRCSI